MKQQKPTGNPYTDDVLAAFDDLKSFDEWMAKQAKDVPPFMMEPAPRVRAQEAKNGNL